MASERNRIVDLTNYLEACGIEVNIGKNKARGNKGYFKVRGDSFRIDVAKNQAEDSVINILAHEFAHFVHYEYDKTLKSLDFIFTDSDSLMEELLAVTVATIPKQTVEPLFKQAKLLKDDINVLKLKLNALNLDYEKLEKRIKKSPFKYLLKYDKVKVYEGFYLKSYSIEELIEETDVNLYLHLKSKQRNLRRLNSKISRLNKYYNEPTELFARAFELFISDRKLLLNTAPTVCKMLEEAISSNKISLLTDFVNNV